MERKKDSFIVSLIILISVLMPLCIKAQNSVKQLTTSDGLSNNSINCIFQDSKGIMWFGTWDGLNAYNGREFKAYQYNNKEYSISNNIIRKIIETDSLHLWIATDDGINRWNRQTEHFDRFFVNLGLGQIAFDIAQTNSLDLICSLKDRGLFYFDEKLNDFRQIKEILSNSSIKKFVIDANNHIFILYDTGILERYNIAKDNGVIKVVEKTLIEDNVHIQNIFLTKNILIVNYGDYIKINDEYNQYPSTIDIKPNKKISQILQINNSFLIGYSDGGCDVYDVKSRTTNPLNDIFSNLAVFSLYNGSQNILWVGTDGQGVFEVYEYNSSFELVKTKHPVRSFCQLSDDEILVGTKGDGIKIYNKKDKSLSNYANTANGLLSNSVYTMARNNKGDVFIATEESGLNFISNNKLQRLILPPNSPFFRYIYSILLTDNDSYIWLGTTGYGLIRIEIEGKNSSYGVKSVKQYSSSNDIKTVSSDIIYSIKEGANPNELWVGTRRGGLFRFDKKDEKFKNSEHILKGQVLTNNDILCLNKTKNDLWVGTGFGLNKIDFSRQDSSIVYYTEEQGISNNTIHGILDDDHGNLWFSSNGGLTYLDISNKTVNNFTTKDGLQSNEFSDGAYFKDQDNTFYFGGVNGFNLFQPNRIHRREFNPNISLSNLKILNTSLSIHDRIKDNTLHLSYDEAYTTLTFWADDYINNENCEYSYRLLNFSDEWINNGQNPNIVLTKLPSGSYELQVKVTNGDRVWGDNIYILRIKVAPPWWFSTWAIIIYIILALILIYISYVVVRNRIKLNRELLLEHIEKENQKKIHESKLNFFTNVAHEFFTPLSLIYGPAQHLIEKDGIDDYTKRYILVIKNNADRMQKLISELMDFRKIESGYIPIHPEKIELKLLIDYICDNYIEIAEENKIDFQIDTTNLSTLKTDRSSLEKILFNLISNAFKYTPESGYIKIIAQQENDIFLLTIQNSGKGLTESQMSEVFNKFKIFDKPNLKNNKSTGIGLSLVKSLVDLLGGTINVKSQLKEYVEFSIQIPSMNNSTNQTDSVIEEANQEINIKRQIEQRKDISILIVEDEKNIRELLKDILMPYYKIYEAGDGVEALNVISQNTPDIIISDILMPNMDGMELVQKLKSESQTAHIPVINISAKNSINDQISAIERGTDLFITKPFHPRHVLATVQNLINKQGRLKDYFTSSLSSLTVKDGIELHREDETFLNEIISFIEKNIDDEMLSPNGIADAMGISKASFYRKMKELTYKTPSEFVRSIRLNHASTLLISTKMTVQEVMFKSGFTNKSYFYREFAKQHNSSPNEYRQSNNK